MTAAPDPVSAAATSSPKLRGWACALLAALALILALRLTMTESLRETLPQKQNRLLAAVDPDNHIALPAVGPAVTTGLAALTLLLAGGAAALAARAGALRARFLRWLIIAGIAALAIVSACRAADRFSAIVGGADLVMALGAGWAVALLCDHSLAGVRGRRLLIALFVAILAAWIMQGLLQHFVDHPDTVALFEKNKDQILRDQGVTPGSPEARAYESRLRGGELPGFLTLANVTAAGFVGLLTILAGVLTALAAAAAPAPRAPSARYAPGQVSPVGLYVVGAAVLLTLGGWMLLLTKSNGGMGMAVICLAAVVPGILLHRTLGRYRRMLVIAGLIAFVGGAGAIVAYGLRHDSLPTKSLRFRWYYWTAAVPLAEQHPLTGVGMNNFGSYYTSVKRPAAPEDVADPHSYFVRAAELGFPAAALLAGLIVWTVLAGTRPAPPAALPSSEGPIARPVNVFMVTAAGALVWWLVHYGIAGPYDQYFFLLALIYAGITAAVAAATFCMLDLVQPRTAALGLAALVGALGMFVYDQINMALLTGPVAMFFWVMLGIAASERAAAAPRRRPVLGGIAGAGLGAAGLAAAGLLWLPVLRGAMAWDPAPAEYRYLRAVNANDFSAARAAVDDALLRALRSVELLRQRIFVEQHLGQPIAGDIRRLLSLDRANARIRLQYALPVSDLPAAERAGYLREALSFDAQLAPDEPKRLSAQDIARVKETLAALEPAASQRR